MVNRKPFVSYITSSALLMAFISPSSWAVEENRLWLPVKYQGLYLPLKRAAQAAESLDRCTKVLQGTIDREQSKPDHPIFRILCKQDSGLTYNEMVDGLTMETLTTIIPVEVVLTPEELEQQRIAEEKRLTEEREANKKRLFKLCDQALKAEAEFMTGLHWYYEGFIEPESVEDDVALFALDFDATNPDGKPLQYRAYCSADGIAPPKLRIKKRPANTAKD